MRKNIVLFLIITIVFISIGCNINTYYSHMPVHITINNQTSQTLSFFTKRIGDIEENSYKNHGFVQARTHLPVQRESGYTYDMYCTANGDKWENNNVYIETGRDYEWTIWNQDSLDPSEIRPRTVDLSIERFFPPIGGPQGGGDCTCWSVCYYYNTYMQSRDENISAAQGDKTIVNSVRFLFGLIAQGYWGAENTRYAMEQLSDIGCSNEVLHPYGEDWNKDDYTRWPTTQAWIQALNNRTGILHKIKVDNEEGIEKARQVLAGGSCLVTRGDYGINYGHYKTNATGSGIDNRVMFRRVAPHGLRHSICIVGYDDTRSYFDDRDRKIHFGAFLMANSEGPGWGWFNSTNQGSKGFIWMAYDMFVNREFGYYNWKNIVEHPGFDNEEDPTLYYHDDRPSYRPKLFAVAGINHEMRNMITFTGGIGSTTSPEFNGPVVLEYTEEGENFEINDSRPVAIDFTDGVDLITPGNPEQVFIQLNVHNTAVSQATITSMTAHYDPEGDGVYEEFYSDDPVVTVSPGDTEYIVVEVYIPD